MLTRLFRRASVAVAFGTFGLLAAMTAGTTQAEDASARIREHRAAGEFGAARQAETATTNRPAELTGTGADFNSLMNLIREQTSGPWEEDEGEGGTMTPFQSGVRVDAKGVLSRVERQDVEGRLAAFGVRARKADLNDDLAKPAELRMVSLTRLEREVAARLARGERVLESMKQLAGLTEIQYVFADPQENEIVIAGPAEGWNYDANGLPVARSTGRPSLRLDDLVVVLRTYEPRGKQIFGCSIDPRADGLKAVKEFVEASQQKGPLASGQARRWAQQIGETLGRQDISVFGVPAESRVARVIVEADYRMKLIGVGKLEGGDKIPSYFDLVAKQPALAQGGLEALRWWLTLNTSEVLFSGDRNAFEIRGASVTCQSENQFVTATGGRASTGKAEPINRQFAENFTANYADLAAKEPVFADLEGVFDLAMAAAIIRHEGLDERTNWNRGAFASNGDYATARYAVPKEVDSVVNHRVFSGKDVVVQVAGGVRADVIAAVTETRRESAEVATVASENKADSNLPAGRWWWDAAK
jgi:hypothetical protein